MKKAIIAILFLVSIFNIIDIKTVSAQSSSVREDAFGQLGAAANSGNLGQPADPRTVVARVIRIGLGVLGTIFLVLTVYAGFLWMTAAGNDEQAGKARKLLYDGVIGLAIILAAYSITYFVSRVLVDTTGTSLQTPNNSDYCIQFPLDPQCAQ